MKNDIQPLLEQQHRRMVRGAWLLGFSLGGFFDGILLHQILQWHHLLSGLETARADLRLQILADGVFHAAMYLVAIAGLWQLARARGTLAYPGAGRLLLAYALIGFGIWHVLDAVLSHWVLGIHRIRMDVANPLLWDLAWLALFGGSAIIAGWALQRSRGRGPGAPFAIVLALVTGAAAWLSASGSGLPADGTRNVTVVLRADVPAAALFAALPEAGARVVWGNAGGDVWVLAVDTDSMPLRLYRHGALWVSGSLLPAGCSAWLRT